MIISIKSSSAGSSRGLIHYLAHSKLDRTKEAVEKRGFFNESENDLDVRAANLHLSLDETKPKPEELLHIVIAPSREEIEQLGGDLKTQKDALKAITRETIAALKKEVKAKNLKWVAALHFNTDHPHAHLAIQKQFLNESGEPEILRITRQMLHYNEKGENGEKKLQKGVLILAAENKISEIVKIRRQELEKTIIKTETRGKEVEAISKNELNKIPFWRERRILAEEMLVAAEIRRRKRNIENLLEHGDKKRFKIKDEQTGRMRYVSLFDIQRKIENESRRKAWQTHPKNAEKREALTVSLAAEERLKYEQMIRGLETIRRHVLGFENRHLAQAQEKHTRLHNQKLLIEKKCEHRKIPVPLPLFNADEIQKLQSEAIREQNSEKMLLLEQVRQSNAAELNRPPRRDEDLREFLGAKIIAKLKMQAAEKRFKEFSATKDFVKVKINDSFWSRRQLEQHEWESERKKDFWTKIKNQTAHFFGKSEVRSKSKETPDYAELNKVLTDALENLEIVRRNELHRQQEFCQTLDKIYAAETSPNKTKLAPAFTATELGEIEELALEAKNENFYEKSLLWQEDWLSEKLTTKFSLTDFSSNLVQSGVNKTKTDAQPIDETKSQSSKQQSQAACENTIGEYVLGRTEARILFAQVKVNQTAEAVAKYKREKPYLKHRITDPKTGARRELSLKDVEPKKHYYLLDNFLANALESKEQKMIRKSVRQAAQDKEQEMSSNLREAQNHVQRLENQKTWMLEKYSTAEKIRPIFTPKEIAALEDWKTKTVNKSEATRIEEIIAKAEEKNRVGRIQNFLENAVKDLQNLTPSLTNDLKAKNHLLDEPSEQRLMTEKSRRDSIQDSISESNLPINKTVESNTLKPDKVVVKEKGRTR